MSISVYFGSFWKGIIIVANLLLCLLFLCSLEDGILSVGQWSDRGCWRNESLSNSSVTVCECNHLTHFAVLLSASPPNFTAPVVLSLEIIGYVGVSISLVAMALTITIFIIIKYGSYCHHLLTLCVICL